MTDKTPIEKAAEDVVMVLPNHLGVDQNDVNFIVEIIRLRLEKEVPPRTTTYLQDHKSVTPYNHCRRDIGLEDLDEH